MRRFPFKKVNALGLSILASLSMDGWAVQNGMIAHGPAYSAVIGLQGSSEQGGCTAVVIHPRAFLTAAHCKDFIDKGFNLISYPDRNTDHHLSIIAIYVDEKYNPRIGWKGDFKVNDDLALAILKDPIEDATILSHIPKIIDESVLAPNDTLMAVGLGMYRMVGAARLGDRNNSDKRMAPYRLQEKRSSVDFLKASIPGVGMCDGDSGGGLLRVSSDGKSSELVGILTAIGGNCGGKNQTDYAESVSSHLDWIKTNLQKEGISLE